MDFTAFVDVAIGLTVVFLGASLCVTVLNEFVAQLFKLRAQQLTHDLQQLIACPTTRQRLADNPALAPLFAPLKWYAPKQLFSAGSPGYVDPQVLAQQLLGGIDTAYRAAGGLAESIEQMPDSALKRNLQALARTASQDSKALVADVGAWFDKSLTMMGEGYKKKAQLISLAIGLAVAVGFNIDTVAITKHLYQDKASREALATMGTELAQNLDADTVKNCSEAKTLVDEARCEKLNLLVDGIRLRNDTLGQVPLGWSKGEFGIAELWSGQPSRWAGWIFTALAVSLGASFWFDLLNRFVNIRHGMRRPEAAGSAATVEGLPVLGAAGEPVPRAGGTAAAPANGGKD